MSHPRMIYDTLAKVERNPEPSAGVFPLEGPASLSPVRKPGLFIWKGERKHKNPREIPTTLPA